MNDEQIKKDLEILRALYFGNHLNIDEIERANKIIFLLSAELKSRLKNK